jgi:hypothetical protein
MRGASRHSNELGPENLFLKSNRVEFKTKIDFEHLEGE